MRGSAALSESLATSLRLRLCAPYGGGIPINLSNSHVSSVSLRKSRASPVLIFVGRSVTSGFFFVLPQTEGAERHAARGRDRADQARRPTSTTSEGGLAVRRSTAASSRLSPRPWGPAALWPRLGLSAPGGDTERARGVCLTPGGLIQGRPGPRLRVVAAGAAPHPRSVSLCRAPLCGSGCIRSMQTTGQRP